MLRASGDGLGAGRLACRGRGRSRTTDCVCGVRAGRTPWSIWARERSREAEMTSYTHVRVAVGSVGSFIPRVLQVPQGKSSWPVIEAFLEPKLPRRLPVPRERPALPCPTPAVWFFPLLTI